MQWREFPSNGVVRRLLSHGGVRNRWTQHRLARLQGSVLPAPSKVQWLVPQIAGLATCAELTVHDLRLPSLDKAGRKCGGRSLALQELQTF